jgi:hypothetical protein
MKTINKFVSYSVAAALTLTPLMASANNSIHVRGDADVRASAEVKHEAKAERTGCLKAFGHLIAPGWIKLHGTTSVDSTCKLPFGIGKKLGQTDKPTHGTTTSGTDTTAPSVFGVKTSVGTSTATISWFTNERSSTQVAYGTSTSYGSTSTLNSDRTFSHKVTLSGLSAGTTYHFAVMSRDAAGNLTTSTDKTFTTASIADATAPLLSSVAVSGVSSTSATVSWTTNEPATSKVFFTSGTSLDLGTASSVTNNALVTNHSVTLIGLSASTTYSYAARSADSSGNVSTSGTGSFVTGL